MDDTFDCYLCNEACALCLDETHTSCSACKPGYYLFPESTICLPYCPTGIQAEDEVCDDTSPQTTCFTFDNKDTAQTVNDASTILLEESNLQPRPVYKRGIYFDGDDQIQLSNLVLNVQFSLSYWLRLDTNSGSLLEIVEHLKFSLHTTSTGVEYDYIVRLFTHTQGAIELDRWCLVAVSVSSDHDVQVYLDNTPAGESTNQGEAFIDSPDYQHILGKGYTGFMYEFCVYAASVSDFPIKIPD